MEAGERRDWLTFKGNAIGTRHGWLRLTPAYSIHLVTELLEGFVPADGVVLDPFAGTGTTALVCAERGIACDTTDINPFLLWLTRVKTRTYLDHEIAAFDRESAAIASLPDQDGLVDAWSPPLHHIEKWWDRATLTSLSRIMGVITDLTPGLAEPVIDLLKLAFCQTMIARANVSFGHQSMSFKPTAAPGLALGSPRQLTRECWEHARANLTQSARSPILCTPRALACDARNLTSALDLERYSLVITSPPYPNRMSYIRELRPYMYWLGYLTNGREAGELDWQAIGGTWGIATSNAGRWSPPEGADVVPFEGFAEILTNIAATSPLLANYVHKYFLDMAEHFRGLNAVTKPGARIAYIVGNSKFYDVVLPVERLFAALFGAAGFEGAEIRTIRKRTSKKELFEYLVTAQKPMNAV